MAFLTGFVVVNAPLSALNNLGTIPGERTDNISGVKHIRTPEGAYPYVSGQALRYWLRKTCENYVEGWESSPVYRGEKIAYTDSNPIKYWDDDTFGYMRVYDEKKADPDAHMHKTKYERSVSRTTPFRTNGLISLGPVKITSDFGVMARQEGHPVPFEHQAYKTDLGGMISFDLRKLGTFTHTEKAGRYNLDPVRQNIAKERGLQEVKTKAEIAYRLPLEERQMRAAGVVKGLASLEGGAKQGLHYTDVTPAIFVSAVTKGGNNIFAYLIGSRNGHPEFKLHVFEEILRVQKDNLLSSIYVGWRQGYLDEQRSAFQEFTQTYKRRLEKAEENGITIHLDHPLEACEKFEKDLVAHQEWLD